MCLFVDVCVCALVTNYKIVTQSPTSSASVQLFTQWQTTED